jgi:hypothetical protein
MGGERALRLVQAAVSAKDALLDSLHTDVSVPHTRAHSRTHNHTHLHVLSHALRTHTHRTPHRSAASGQVFSLTAELDELRAMSATQPVRTGRAQAASGWN